MGSWQLIRLNWKNNLIIEIEDSLKNLPVELDKSNVKNYLKIKTSGSVDLDKQTYLYNLNDNGTPGFEVINPILIDNEKYLNHSNNPTVDEKGYALKNIKIGDEITIDYNNFDDSIKAWLT